MTKPWDRLPKESIQAREAFLTYRDMGTDRSTAAVGRQLGKSKALMDRWSSTYRWVERVAAWDAHLEALLVSKQEAAVAEMARRHAERAKALQDIPAPLLEELARRAKGGDLKRELRSLPVEDVLDNLSKLGRTFKVGVDVERLAAGVPTAQVRHDFAEETSTRLRRLFGDEDDKEEEED